jgi:tetratricopeptide (TPR) repeat protein
MKRTTFIAVVFVLSMGLSLSQTNDNKFRLAESYEQGGDFENAAKLYKELLTADPNNYPFFDGLRRSYIQLKRYDDAISAIHQRLESNRNDLNLLCLLGSALYQSGKEKDANAAWENAVAVDPTNANTYRFVSNSLLENRLLEKAAELYRRARNVCGDENLFTIDLAQLLGVMMDYSGATTEFLRFLAQTPMQLGYVQNRLAQFTGKEEARSSAIDALRSAKVRPDELTVQRLLGWLILEGKDYAEAFDVYKKVDKLANARGVELFAFADRAYREGAYAIAAEAYKAAADAPLSKDRLPYAEFGYALAMKEQTLLVDTLQDSGPVPGRVPESFSRYATAIDYFRNVVAAYPNTDIAAKSYYQIGRIQFEKYFDLDGALASFANVENPLVRLHSVQHDVANRIGEVLTAKGDTVNAAVRFRAVIAAANATPDQQDEATYRLAELAYFRGDFKEAITLLDNISTNLKADYTNDALQLLSFLQENTITAELALKEFARADYFARQKKNTEAISILQNLIDKNPQALFVDDGLMRVAALQTQARLYTEALSSYQTLLGKFKESSIALDKAQFNIARLYDIHLKDKRNAIAAYEKLLADYPQSLLVDAARKRIRGLRGDSL